MARGIRRAGCYALNMAKVTDGLEQMDVKDPTTKHDLAWLRSYVVWQSKTTTSLVQSHLSGRPLSLGMAFVYFQSLDGVIPFEELFVRCDDDER